MKSDYTTRTCEDLPQAIRRIRLRLGLTGAEFGKLLKWPTSSVSQYECAHMKPSATRLIALFYLARSAEESEPVEHALESYGVRPIDLIGISSESSSAPGGDIQDLEHSEMAGRGQG